MSFLLDALAGTTPSNELVGVETAVGTDLDVGVTVSKVPSGPLPSSSSASVLLNNSSTGVVVVLCNCFFLSLVASSKTSAYFSFTLFNSFFINLCNNHICFNCVGVLCLAHLFRLVLTFC